MLRLACTILTITAMLAHCVLGCGICHAGCSHAHQGEHATVADHDDAHHAAQDASHEDHATQATSCRHHTSFTEDHVPCTVVVEEHSSQHPGEPCSASGCCYVGASVVKIPLLQESTELLPCDLLALSTPAILECVAQAADGYRGGYPPALRAQIWIGAWLV